MNNRGYLYFSLFLISCQLNHVFAGDLTATAYLRLFQRNGSYYDVNVRNASQLISKINIKVYTVVFIHGYGEDINSADVQTMKSAYLNYTDVNYIAIDYRDASHQIYTTSVAVSVEIGKLLANGLNDLIKEGLSPQKLHVIGHSLGAQVAGVTGRNTAVPISRVTGLDPAGPLFYVFNQHLGSGDAEFVDIIHTDMGALGIALTTGDADFFPHLGFSPQPGCPIIEAILSVDLCSHQRSFQYYVQSIIHPNIFIATECDNSEEFITDSCKYNRTVVMGYNVPNTTRGSYYLQTGANSPYGLGEQGAVFHLF